MKTLADCRKELDALDDVLLETYLHRMRISEEIGRIKAVNGLAVYDKTREDEIISRRTASLDQFDAAAVEALFRTIFTESRRIQTALADGKGDTHE